MPKGELEPISRRWDAEYRRGRYANEAPIPFIGEILKALQENREAWMGLGLYVGCGNGRNYLPLVEAGATLKGLDISKEAIRRLRVRRRDLALQLNVGDFREYRRDAIFNYIIAIQVFQHGSDEDAALYFANAAANLVPGGLFFLRANSASTEIYHRYKHIDRNRFGGFTIRYEEGPKRGLLIHFYSREELLARTEREFALVRAPHEDVILRSSPKGGSWTQWEVIWMRRK
jgi:trans-aconitate methyltransferase